jgi:hypothetical protein
MASIVVSGDTSGAITIAAPAVAGTNTLTLPASTGTLVVTGGAQTVQFAAGTVSLPSITTTGDTNTGIFFPAADTIAFTEGGTESMRIDSSGNVGIGTSSPGQKLEVYNANGGAILRVTSSATGTGSGNGFHIGLDGDGLAYLVQNENQALLFSTNATERMRIDSSGHVLIGKTAASGTTQGIFLQGDGIYGFTKNESGTGPLGYFVNANGTVDNGYRFASFRVTSGFTEVGTITTNGSSTTAYNTSSDYRLKENIAPMTGALATVSALKPVTYKWKIDGSAGQGFIAHELQAVVPDCVTGEKDAVNEDGSIKAQGIDTSFLVATLTAAIQEQQQIINDLKARIETLENT